ncbi:MAG TPA: hypothetical protein VLG48_13965 [Candidatus Methylomirabilis sp.]|nr:hypothetical protein [Candidatus Methylomirabilis sp.]
MDWKEIGPYRGHILWVRELPTEGWLVGIVPDRAAAVPQAPPPEERVLPEAFGSEVAAVAAAMRFLDREEARRSQQKDP